MQAYILSKHSYRMWSSLIAPGSLPLLHQALWIVVKNSIW